LAFVAILRINNLRAVNTPNSPTPAASTKFPQGERGSISPVPVFQGPIWLLESVMLRFGICTSLGIRDIRASPAISRPEQAKNSAVALHFPDVTPKPRACTSAGGAAVHRCDSGTGPERLQPPGCLIQRDLRIRPHVT
jgi:hypothetical protein